MFRLPALLSNLPRALRIAAIVAAGLLLIAIVVPLLVTPWLGGRVHAFARPRGLEASWKRLAFQWPATVVLRGLVLRHGGAPGEAGSGPTVFSADRAEASLAPRFGSLKPRVARLVLGGARIVLPAEAEGAPDAGADQDPKMRTGPAAPRVRAAAEQLVDVLLLPARRLPELELTDIDVVRGDSLFARLDALTLLHRSGGAQFAAVGLLAGDQHVPFDATLQWSADDRLTGRAGFHVPDDRGGDAPLAFLFDGHVSQDRHAGILRIEPGTRLTVGQADLLLDAEVRRAGPRFRLALEIDHLSADAVQQSLPRAVLGPLRDLAVTGSWDWRASVDVDVSQPDSTHFSADVIPHGLALDARSSRLRLNDLARPFVAAIHVPPDRIVYRDLSDSNENFRPLTRISPLLKAAVLTNEDGGFYQHRGFNPGAIQGAMADNLRAGAFRRGAGTITMQLARNLYLGHRRTLSRKAQEVVLAWVLEHLTGLSKDRLLEIYLNIIEWGPDVHGANEAARYYFGKDASELSLDEALFLTVVIPSPSRWRTRVDARGELRPWARSQMAFIARKMAEHQWLVPEQVPPDSTLHVTLRGRASELLNPRASAAADSIGG
jgi:hypothetical protein